MRKIKIFSIADIHFGKLHDSKRLYEELKEHFISRINIEKPDIVVLCGDTFDRKVSLDSDHTIYANRFIHELTQTNALIILIRGTLSHDSFQLNAYSHLTNDKFRIYDTATIMNYEGYKFLILPEENMLNIENYYKSLLNPKTPYSMVFGHGNFSFGGFSLSSGEHKTKMMFKAEQFDDIVDHRVLFGHYHIKMEKRKVIYIGSFTRLDFNDEKDEKGFLIHEIEGNKLIREEFIPNTSSLTFKTIKAKDVKDLNVDELMSKLKELSIQYHKIRIEIDEKIDEGLMNNIIGFVKNNENVSLIKSKSLNKINIEKEKSDIYNKNKKELEKYKDLSFIEITKKIAKDDYNYDFSDLEINKILNEKE